MSNNNRNNNRRRGRGNNRSQGGGNQLNRIDSRARGNAPQLLEKYKKLAHDAALNGDRVQAEYYLQFADHYFRVTADSRTQKDDPRGPRRDEREPGDEQDYFEDEFDRGQRQEPRRRDEPVADNGAEDGDDSRQPAETADFEGEAYEAADNPFTRPERDKPRRGRRERPEEFDEDDDAGNRLDPSVLPGAIAAGESDVEDERAEEREEDPAPARRALKPRRSARSRGSDDDEELEAVG